MHPTTNRAPGDRPPEGSRLNERRLAILDSLERRASDVSLSELAAELAERADHRPDGSDADRIAVRLHHADLPLLADAGLLEYDVDERTVAARPAHGRPGRVY